MPVQNSTAVRNAQADAWETAIGTSARIRLYSGAMPASTAAARTGTLGVEYALASDWCAAAVNGVKTLNNLPIAGTAAASAVIGYYSFMDSAGTTCHEQGIVAEPWAASRAYVVGQQVLNGGNVYRCTVAGTSAGSGGPTGTGTGITDGGVTWNFVVAGADMTLDNTSIASGQTVNVTGFTKTWPGA